MEDSKNNKQSNDPQNANQVNQNNNYHINYQNTQQANQQNARQYQQQYNQQYWQRPPYVAPKKKTRNKVVIGIVIALIVIIIIVSVVSFFSLIADGLASSGNAGISTVTISGSYIGVVYVEGTISEGVAGTYDHNYIMTSIDDMIYDTNNEGLMLYINTPGGSVYASDELYLKIMEYKDTGRPVYTYMASQATSGGYYIAAPSDKIIANRNTWTGSIGVTIGTFLDVSQLLSDLGVKATTITSGPNKAMGGNYDPMTQEQMDIFQSLVDEAYYQFVDIVAEGRGFSMTEAVEIADGRIYTAQQALELNLIDEIATYEEAISTMQSDNDLGHVDTVDFYPLIEVTFLDLLYGMTNQGDQDALTSEYEAVMEIVNGGNEFNISYISEMRKSE